MSFFLLGTINNFGYVVVISAAKSLADGFGKKELYGVITWANVGFGFFFRAVNTFALEHVAYKWRVAATTLMNLLGMAGLVISFYINFWFAIAMIVLLGSGGSSFGESVMLGYLKRYPASLVDGWSSGTGMAGVAGSLMYIVLVAAFTGQSENFTNQMIFLILTPTALLYIVTYAFALSEPKQADEQEDGQQAALLADEDGAPTAASVDAVTETGGQRYWRCTKIVAWRSFNLFLVYFFEYVCITGAGDRASDLKGDWFRENAYAIFQFCYQVGVLCSRSSLKFFKFPWIEILTLLQAVNFFILLAHDKWPFINIWVLFALMFYAGLLGGASYVNVFYLLLHDKAIPDKDREVCINLAAFAITAGITSSSIFTLVMENTFLK